MLYYLVVFFLSLVGLSFISVVIVALVRIVVNQQYPPLTMSYFSAELVECFFMCFVIIATFFGWLSGDIYQGKEKNINGLDVIIVPGYEMNRWSSKFLQKYLQTRGHRVVCAHWKHV